MSSVTELPRYKSLKTIWALKIRFINPGNDNIVFVDDKFIPMKLSKEYFSEHQPHVGGYFVIHEDGKQGFMSADDMEDNFALIEN